VRVAEALFTGFDGERTEIAIRKSPKWRFPDAHYGDGSHTAPHGLSRRLGSAEIGLMRCIRLHCSESGSRFGEPLDGLQSAPKAV
jgi:hypothetical protein